ncbi:MAG: molybdate ABC transporter permease subunit, partial [Reyranellaceae bacterium]
SAEEVDVVLLSLKVAFWSMVLTLPVAIALAWLLSRRDFWGKSLLDAAVHLPLVLPPVVVGYALLLLFGRNGPIGRLLDELFGVSIAFAWEGAAVAAAVMGLPLAVRTIRLSFDAIDRRLEHAARTLGATRWDTFLVITLPLALPGILAGLVLSFARGLGEFGATITFVSNIPGETRTLPLAEYTYLQQPGSEEPALRLAVLSVILAFAALLAAEHVNRALARRLGVAK